MNYGSRFGSKVFGSFAGLIVLTAVTAAVWLAAPRALTKDADGDALTVTARIDQDCKSLPQTFEVPSGKTAHAFKKLALEPGSSCHGGGVPENQGFMIRDSHNKPVYMWSQYQKQPPYEKGGPLSALTLEAGSYTLSVAGGAGAKIELSYKLK